MRSNAKYSGSSGSCHSDSSHFTSEEDTGGKLAVPDLGRHDLGRPGALQVEDHAVEFGARRIAEEGVAASLPGCTDWSVPRVPRSELHPLVDGWIFRWGRCNDAGVVLARCAGRLPKQGGRGGLWRRPRRSRAGSSIGSKLSISF